MNIMKLQFSGDQLFLLFDTVHILKSVKNNWLNQRFPSKEIRRFPLFEVHDKIQYGKLGDLLKIYECEEASYIKHAPSLSEKVFSQHPLKDRMRYMQFD